jgi:uncharacterized membrane protein
VQFFKKEWRAVVGHFVSFGVLGVHWCIQNYVSAMTKRPTIVMYAISIGHCMAAALFPFTMKLALLAGSSWWEVAYPILCYADLALTQVFLWLRASGKVSERQANWLLIGVVVFTVVAYLCNEIYQDT